MSLRPLFVADERVWQALDEGWAVITPNRRLSRAVSDAFAVRQQQTAQKAWVSGNIAPMRQWWLQRWQRAVTRGILPPANPVDADVQRLLWQQVIEEDRERIGFSLISTDRAARLAQEAHERLLLWELDLSAPEVAQAFSLDPDARTFLRWFERYEQRLSALALTTPEMCIRNLAGNPGALDTPALQLYCDDVPPLFQSLGNQLPEYARIDRPTTVAETDSLRAFPDDRRELLAIARWCRERTREDPEGRYGVVLPDMQASRDILETLLRREFDCLTRNYDSLPVNFATGFRLAEVPIVRDALLVLKLCRNRIAVEDLSAALHSRFLPPATLGQADRARLLRLAFGLASEQLPQGVLRQVVETHCDDETMLPWNRYRQLESQGLLRGRQSASVWTGLFVDMLTAWGWPRNRSLDSLEFQQLERFRTALDDFSTRDALYGGMSYEEALGALLRHLSDQMFQPQTEDAAIQVLGRLETTGLAFDGLWVAGMRADRWPEQSRANPYLPRALQRQMRMPHIDSAWEFERAQERWRDWRSGATELLCSFVAEEDGAPVPPSPMIQAAPQREEQETPAFPSSWRDQARRAAFEDIELTPLPIGSDERAREGVAAAALEQQALCPFQAFAAQRLRVAPLGDGVVGLSPSERGSMLHRALFQLYGDIPDSHALESLGETGRKARAVRAARDASLCLSSLRRSVLGHAVFALEEQRLCAVLMRWLRVDERREIDWTVVERESQRELSLAGLLLKLRLDRVDALSDGSHVIIDYKGGALEPLDRWFEERPRRPQLPLYALGDERARAISYASLKVGKQGFRGVGVSTGIEGMDTPTRWINGEDEHDADAEAKSFDVLREGWRSELTGLAMEFVNGVNDVDPTLDACRYCHRQSLCRIGDLLP